MRKQNFGILQLLILICCCFFPFVTVTATSKEQSVGYSVQKINPEGAQVSESSSYYDLLVTPGETRSIQARIQNSESAEITVHSDIFTTYTNANGEISYTDQAEEYDKSLNFMVSDFTEIVASDIDAVIPPQGSKEVTVMIQVPEDIPDGVYLGSWYFVKEGQEVTESSGEGISINNMYSYALAIKLTVNQEIAEPNLNLLNITTDLNNHRKVINANLQNDQPAVLSNLNVKAEVMKRDQFEILYENEISNLIMAPNSNYSFPIFYNDLPMTAGKYSMHIIATTTDQKWPEKTWEWTENFTITENEVRALTAGAINDPQSPEESLNWLLIFLLAILILLLIILLIILYHRKKRKEKLRKKRLQMKQKTKNKSARKLKST
ncbi:DUF916 and DUF3324 domain-containing protein [Enterococcus sp. LJL90]